MPNFKVFSESAAQLLAQVSNLTPASLVTQVSNLTAACLVTQMSNLTATCLLTQVSQPTATCLLTQVSQPTATCLLTQVSQPTATCLLTQVSQPTATCLLTQVSQPTASCLLTASTIQDRATSDTLINVADTGDTTFKDTTAENVLELTDLTFTVINSGTSNSALARLELSADDVTYSIDPTVAAQTLDPAAQFFFVPGRFTKYAKIQYASVTATLTTTLSVWFQAHV